LKTVLSKELDFEENKNVLIHVGRWDPLKDYENLIESLHHLKILRKDFMALLVGKEISYENSHLVELIKKYDLDSYVKLLGRREDVPKLMASADLFISSSSNEGFPNVIGEAMASETYCVVTDAGDSSSLIGNEGKIVKVKSPKDLANALGESLSMSSEELQIASEKARKRIIDNFTIEYATNEYQKLYEIKY
jgi:glycosyltransferase involved in cell wall biosynthesis